MYPSGPTAFAGLPSLSFFRYSDQRVEQIAVAPTEPDGTVGGIIDARYAGDWVSYVTEDSSRNNWVLWVYNIKSGQRLQIDSQAHEGIHATWQTQVSNATDLVWAYFTGSPSGVTSAMFDYTYSTGQTQTLATSTSELLKPMAMNSNAALIIEVDINDSGASTWVQPMDHGKLRKIADGGGVNAWMSSRYAVWDDPHSSTTSLYDLSSNRLDVRFAPCLRPAIADAQPYMVCVQFSSDSWFLVHVPDGAQTPFDVGKASLGDGGAIYKGRAFFVGPTGDLEYFDLPSQ